MQTFAQQTTGQYRKESKEKDRKKEREGERNKLDMRAVSKWLKLVIVNYT